MNFRTIYAKRETDWNKRTFETWWFINKEKVISTFKNIDEINKMELADEISCDKFLCPAMSNGISSEKLLYPRAADKNELYFE